jgi:hypothetical protein
MYQTLANRIDQLHPELILELNRNDLPRGKEKLYTLGNFAEIVEEDRQGCNQYYIYMYLDHVDAQDDVKLSGALAHEYGHFLCRTVLYPNLFIFGTLISQALKSREPGKISDKFSVNLIVLMEELTAWLVGWGTLLKLKSLKKEHLRYGWRCWKTYWKQMRRWIKKN